MGKKLPEGWEWKKLNDLAQFIYGYPFDSSKFNNEGQGTPLIRIRNLIKDKTDTFFDGEFEESYLVRNGDILIGMDGEFNIVRWGGEGALLNQRICKLESTSDTLIPSYAFRVLKKILKRIEDKTPHVTVKHLSAKQLNSIQIPFPPLETQRKIVAILEKSDETKRLRMQADELTSQLLQSVFLEMFGDPVKNPKRWEIYKLQDVSEIRSGVTKGRKLAGKSVVSVPYLRVANVQDGYLDLNEIKTIEVLLSDVDKYALLEGDVLLTEGGDPDKLGRGAVLHDEIPNCIHQNHIFRVRVNKEYLVPEFLSMLIGSAYGKMYFLKSAKQTTGIATINSTQLKKFPALAPPTKRQNKFAQIVEKVEAMRQNQKQSRQEIDNLFNALMQKAFKGELVA